jgi:aminoglycoside/choline kinase family phosphotransferase
MAAIDPSAPKRALAPPARALVAETVHTKLPFLAELLALAPLTGDASNRRYFRLELAGGPPRSLVLMQLAEPEAFKQSEEAVSGTAVPVTELPYINVLNHLAKADVAVPTLYYYDQAAGLLYLEDFGDLLLVQACQDATGSEIRRLYREAIDTLVQIQSHATALANPACLAFHRTFDVPLLMWEFSHFLEYGVGARHGKPMAPEDERPVRAEFQKIAELLAAQQRVFTHRDYHSRNLMVREARTNAQRLGVLDFQDALLGPASYDLASLLRDAYIELPEPVLDEMLEYYLELMAQHGVAFAGRPAFRRLFDLTSIQRNLKAAGRFVYIDRVKKNPKFLADIPRTLGYVRRNLAKYPELATLRKHLAPYVPELQD